MISGTRNAVTIPARALLLVLALLTTPILRAAEPLPAESLIAALAKPAPATLAFTEIRFSALLKQPMKVSGQLGYQGAHSLDRRVIEPYREETLIRGNAVRVLREGEPERSFAIKRAPELQLLMRTFTAMLEGDASAIAQDFAIDVTRHEPDWQLRLTPKDSRLARRVRQIRIDGRNDLPRCLAIVNDERSASIMLLGPAVHWSLPQVLTREWLERTCAASE